MRTGLERTRFGARQLKSAGPRPFGFANASAVVLVLAAGMSASCALLNPKPSVPLADAVANVRDATLPADPFESSAAYRVSGTCRQGGLEGRFTLTVDRQGRFLQRIAARLSESIGFDGADTWSVDSAGIARVVGLEEEHTLQAWMWVQGGYWLDFEHNPFEATVNERESNDRTLALDLERRDGPFAATLFLDRTSWLPKEMLRQRPAGLRRTTFDDWRAPLGFSFPHRVEVTDALGDASVFEVESIANISTTSWLDFSCPPSRGDGTTFVRGLPGRLETRRSSTGHLLVRASVGGVDGWFLVDTGAGAACISPELADRLNMEPLGRVSVVGVGGVVPGRYRTGAKLAVGPMVVENLTWLELDLAPLEQLFNAPLAGVLGYDFFARAVVMLDFESGTVDVLDPDTLPADSFAWQALRLDGRTPCIVAGFPASESAWFRIDTGSDDTVTFHGPTVEKHGLGRGQQLVSVRAGGVGGQQKLQRGTIKWFDLAGHRFERPVVSFFGRGPSAYAAEYTAGTLGAGFLSTFRLMFDYRRRRVAFLPAS